MGGNAVDSTERRQVSVLWLLLGLALLIRVWGIDYGLPFVYWTDEYHEVMRALELGAGGFNLSRTGKGGFYLLLFIEYGFYYVVLKVAGVISTAQEFAEHFVRDPTAFYVMGRATAALFGSATVAAAYYLARHAYLARAGILAALFLALNVLHVDLSHKVGVDVPMTLFATLAIYFGLRVASDGSRRDYVLAALCAALATTTKLPGILVLPPLLIAHTYFVARSAGGPSRWFTSWNLWLALAIFIAVLAVTNPGILLHFDYLSLFSAASDDMLDGDAVDAAAALDAFSRPSLYLYYLDVSKDSMGWPLFAFATGSVGYALWKHRPADVILISYAAINYLAITSTTSEFLFFPRYALPIIVVLAVLTGRALADLIQFIPFSRLAASATLVAVLIATPLIQTLIATYSLTQTDTRTLAKVWFDSHVPAGSKVLIEGGKIAASRLTVPLADSREALEARIGYWKIKEPRQAKFLEVKRAVHDAGGYDLELVKIASIAPLDDYIARGIEYFVIRPDFFVGSRKAEGGSARLLSALRSDTRARLLRRFDAGSSMQPGPAIEIYQVEAGIIPGD